MSTFSLGKRRGEERKREGEGEEKNNLNRIFLGQKFSVKSGLKKGISTDLPDKDIKHLIVRFLALQLVRKVSSAL